MSPEGEDEEVERWLRNFVLSHAKRESPRVEATVDAEGARARGSYGIRLRCGDVCLPPQAEPSMALPFAEVAEGRGRMAWCEALAARVTAMARELVEVGRGKRSSA
ncbi:MAG: hypothetical protein HYV93_02325 [Candidatus Rokubacteria bacterium]|nr:hypothetical protein [Candidatus Rokubacteria bacterium]